jgi:hypothetical protein
MSLKFTAKVALLTFSAASQVQAVTATSTPWTVSAADLGAHVKLSMNGIIDGQVATGLGAEIVLMLTGVSANSRAWTFDLVSLSNLTGPAPASSRVSTFGFNIFDDTAATFTSATASGSYAHISYKVSPPQLDGSFSVCFRSVSSGNCNGGGSGGVWPGSPGSGQFTLNFSSAVGNVTLDNFFVRYQSIDNLKGFANGNSAVGVANWLEPLPEPGTWVQLIAGFGLIGATMRRLRYSTQSSPVSR